MIPPKHVAKLTSIGIQNGDNVRSVVEKLFTKIEATEVEIKECIRIPARREGQTDDTPKKLLVKLTSPKMQKKVLEKAKNMKKIEGWGSTYISPDLTKAQREKAYQLRVEKRRRTQAGESNLIIRNGAVVAKESRPFREPRDEGRPS